MTMIFNASDEKRADVIYKATMEASNSQLNNLYNLSPSNSIVDIDGTLDICTSYDVTVQTIFYDDEKGLVVWVNYTFGMY